MELARQDTDDIILHEICQSNLCLSPKIFLLNILPQHLSKQQKHICWNVITAARICFASYWKKEEIPSELEIYNKMLDVTEMDILTDKLNEKKKDVEKIWKPFYDWLKKKSQ